MTNDLKHNHTFKVGDIVSRIFPDGVRRTGRIDFVSINLSPECPYQVIWNDWYGDENYISWAGNDFILEKQNDQ